MNEVLFKNDGDLTEEMLAYYANEAENLSDLKENEINHFIDRQSINPLLSEVKFNDEIEGELTVPNYLSTNSDYAISLNQKDIQHVHFAPEAWLGIKERFRRIKKKIKEIFCSVLGSLDWKNMKTSEIIKSVLLALIPSMASGVLAALMPIIIGLIAILLKKGYGAVCPVSI